MVQAFVLRDVVEAPYAAGLEIGGSINDTVDSGPDGRHCTHGARLEGHNQRAAFQPPVFSLGCALSKGEDLCMRCGIGVDFTTIVCLGQNSAVTPKNDRAHGHIAVPQRALTFG